MKEFFKQCMLFKSEDKIDKINMELISLDTLIKVYKVFDFTDSRSTGEIKELADYCDNVKSYLHSVHSTDLEFYKGMLEHDNFLDRMVTLLYMVDKVYYELDDTPDFTKFNHDDFKLVRQLTKTRLMAEPYPNKESLEQAYYGVFKNEIIANKRVCVLNQVL